MDYSRLVSLYQSLEQEPGRLKKTGLLAQLLKDTPEQLLPDVALLAQGSVFPAWDQREVGIAEQSVRKIVAQVSGILAEEVSARFAKLGDYGTVIESLSRSQRTLAAKKLTVEKVVENLRAAAEVSGSGSQERKAKL
ncbi:MAG TPA: DNA ligase, partial [archaeon]|nr:DNA ligase [archaeon]